MTAPYSYTGEDGDRLEVFPSPDGPRLAVSDGYDGHTTYITVDLGDLPGLVAALYRAAGRRAPVLINPDEVADDWVRVTGTAGAA